MLEGGGDPRLRILGLACAAKEEGSGGEGDSQRLWEGSRVGIRPEGVDEMTRGEGGRLRRRWRKGRAWRTTGQSRFGEELVVSWAPRRSVSGSFHCFKAPGVPSR